MPHYKDANGALYWLDSKHFVYMLPAGCIEIGEDEAEALSKKIQDEFSSLTPEQAMLSANSRRDELLSVAGLRISPLQDAIDIGVASDESIKLLLSWKEYRIKVSEINQQSGYPLMIQWPEPPVGSDK